MINSTANMLEKITNIFLNTVVLFFIWILLNLYIFFGFILYNNCIYNFVTGKLKKFCDEKGS